MMGQRVTFREKNKINRSFYRPEISSIALSVLVALFLVLGTNQTFWSKVHANLGSNPGAVAALYVAMTVLFIAAITAFSVKYLTKPFFILLILTAAVASWFTDRFGVVVDSDMIRNAYETTPAEAQHLITPAFAFHLILFAVLPIAVILWVRVTHRPLLQKIIWNSAVIFPSLALFVFAGFSYSAVYTAAIREHKDIVKTLNPVTPLAGTIKFLMDTGAEAQIVVQPVGRDAKITRAVDGSTKPRVTIIVAGETARAQNFSLGGYGRDTNPALSKQDIIYFPNTSSCGTATATSLPCMFSRFTRSNYSHAKGLANETLLDVLATAGADVEWWDNSTGSKGVADRVKFVSLASSSDARYCKMNECQDGVFLDKLDTWLNSVTKDSVLVLHQMGSHGPAYYLRYPYAFRRFQPECKTAELGSCKDSEIVNAYDNTIFYTDFILSSVIDKLKANSARLQSAMIYMSDHGESLGENGLYLHGAPYMLAPDVQTKVPFVLWMGSEFQQSMGVDKACLVKDAGLPRSHDNLFHSVLSMMNVTTRVYDPSLDIFADCKGGRSS
jgi:lipid A ethanolaminephosphotransferase